MVKDDDSAKQALALARSGHKREIEVMEEKLRGLKIAAKEAEKEASAPSIADVAVPVMATVVSGLADGYVDAKFIAPKMEGGQPTGLPVVSGGLGLLATIGGAVAGMRRVVQAGAGMLGHATGSLMHSIGVRVADSGAK